VADLRNEAGTSLVWFIAMLSLIVMVCITLSASVHQYLFARELKDFLEEYALAAKSLLDQGQSQSETISTLESKVVALFHFKSLHMNLRYLDSKTIEVLGCATWQAPVGLIQATREICESALAR